MKILYCRISLPIVEISIFLIDKTERHLGINLEELKSKNLTK